MHNLISYFGARITRHFKQPRPELGYVIFHSAWAHLLSCLLPHEGIRTPTYLNKFIHVFCHLNPIQIFDFLVPSVDYSLVILNRTILINVLVAVLINYVYFIFFLISLFLSQLLQSLFLRFGFLHFL